ncbi:PAS domain-containing protein [Trichocoleus sp. FACHB-90]|uniref:PAS domain-containing protein n=1 Tax=Cyanophyceae TaxID=3028117 RepID=UPI001685C3B7|nr:PAS domain-containing protein [Trichocoleus sp. FACHB-90]MBD1928501.1 PAS domain-containing protein [Trichocoleus sp. FACHB-90]
MNFDEFFQDIKVAHWRAATLNEYARKSILQQQDLVLESFEELYAALEKLQVAQEQLSLLNQKLAAAHQVAQAERQRYQDLLEFIPPCLVTDMAGVIQEANSAAATMLNVPQRFLVGKPLVLFVVEQERRAFRWELNRLCQVDRLEEWKVHLRSRDREQSMDVSLTVATIRNWGGKAIALRWLLRDITLVEEEGEELRLLKEAVQQIEECIVITSAELDEPGPKILFVNPTFTKMTGYTAEEIIGKTPRILQGSKTDRSVLEKLRRNLSQGQPFQGETINYSKDGKEYKVQFNCAPIHNERGEIKHFLSRQRYIPLEHSNDANCLETPPSP